MTLVPDIVDQVSIFSDIMMERAGNNTLFRMKVATTKLTIETIARVVLDHDLHSQVKPAATSSPTPSYHKPTGIDRMGVQFRPLELIDFRIDIVQAWNNYKMNRSIGRLLDERFSAGKEEDTCTTPRRKHVIDLALEAYFKDKSTTENLLTSKNPTTLDPNFRTAAISNIKTFLFAGHNTTSGTISYALCLPGIWGVALAGWGRGWMNSGDGWEQGVR